MTKTSATTLFIACVLVLSASCVRETPQQRTPAGWHAYVSTLAGDGAPGFADGAARASRFADPFGVAVGTDGNVYVADAGESNRIRKVTAEGIVTTIAGSREGFADGAGAAAAFNTPSALALDSAGNLYVADTGNNRVRSVDTVGTIDGGDRRVAFATAVRDVAASGLVDGVPFHAQIELARDVGKPLDIHTRAPA